MLPSGNGHDCGDGDESSKIPSGMRCVQVRQHAASDGGWCSLIPSENVLLNVCDAGGGLPPECVCGICPESACDGGKSTA